MTAIEEIKLEFAHAPASAWPEIARRVQAWLRQHGASPRDAVLLLPFAELLPPCRHALSELGGWMPRVETLRTLAASLAPAPAASGMAPSGDAAVDRLLAERLMADSPVLRDWRRRDRPAFEQATVNVVEAAHGLMRAAAAIAPAERADWWATVHAALVGSEGPGAMESALARVAAQWAAQSTEFATDALFEHRASAWVVLEAGGSDPISLGLLTAASSGAGTATGAAAGTGAVAEASGVPCLRLVADAIVGEACPDPFDDVAQAAPQLLSVASGEDEAWAACAVVIDAVDRGQTPVALIAQDRLLVRRIRALMERAGLSVADESGWVLSTTRPASQLMALLRAAHPQAGPDAWLDGLKATGPGPTQQWLMALERQWRRNGLAPQPGSAAAKPDTSQWSTRLLRWKAFATPPKRSLQQWLAALSELADEQLPANIWGHDPVAERVRLALRLDMASVRPDLDTWSMDLTEFTRWVEQVLEQATYIAPVPIETAQVIITPLARAMLRPFGFVLLPGADERQLGPVPPGPALLPQALLRELKMDDAQATLARATQVFCQLLRHPHLTLLRRRAEGSEPVGPSPWVDRLQAARVAQQLSPLPELAMAARATDWPAQPVAKPQPQAGLALPETISASAVEALRDCPYRFYGRTVLRLAQADELEADPDKRDHGSLLHAALHRFHAQRDAKLSLDEQAAALVTHCQDVAREAGLDGPAMLPYAAGLADFAQRYLHWLQARDAGDWAYLDGEIALSVPAVGVDHLQLRGRIDRMDRAGDGALQLIDYKTGSTTSLKDKVSEPLEDTQLAFYAAQMLLSRELPQGLTACYLALDERDGIDVVEHPKVAESAQALIDGLAHDWQRMRDGAPLLALGEGRVCDHCEMRGLCRRDHWAVQPPSPPSNDPATEPLINALQGAAA